MAYALPTFKIEFTPPLSIYRLQKENRNPYSRLILLSNKIIKSSTLSKTRYSISDPNTKALTAHTAMPNKCNSLLNAHWKYKKPTKLQQIPNTMLIKGVSTTKAHIKLFTARSSQALLSYDEPTPRYNTKSPTQQGNVFSLPPTSKPSGITLYRRAATISNELAFKMDDLLKESPIKMTSLLRNEMGCKSQTHVGVLKPIANVIYRI